MVLWESFEFNTLILVLRLFDRSCPVFLVSPGSSAAVLMLPLYVILYLPKPTASPEARHGSYGVCSAYKYLVSLHTYDVRCTMRLGDLLICSSTEPGPWNNTCQPYKEGPFQDYAAVAFC